MTYYEKLKETSVNGRYICAERSTDKYSDVWQYEIIDIPNGCCIVSNTDITKCAKTTWRRKYNEIVASHQG